MNRPLVLGHRGASAVAPENTLAAFRAALAAGADGVELDVRVTADGVPVVLHDATLDRTAGRPGRLDRIHSGALTRTDAGSWFARRFRAERVPTLESALESLGRARIVNLEIKRAGADGGRDLERILHLVRDRGPGEVLLTSFDEGIVAGLARRAGSRRTGLLVRRGLLRPLAAARRLGAGTLVLASGQLGPRRAERARASGLRVWVHAVRTVEEWDLAVRAGCEGVIGDDPALLLRWRGLKGAGG